MAKLASNQKATPPHPRNCTKVPLTPQQRGVMCRAMAGPSDGLGKREGAAEGAGVQKALAAYKMELGEFLKAAVCHGAGGWSYRPAGPCQGPTSTGLRGPCVVEAWWQVLGGCGYRQPSVGACTQLPPLPKKLRKEFTGALVLVGWLAALFVFNLIKGDLNIIVKSVQS